MMPCLALGVFAKQRMELESRLLQCDCASCIQPGSGVALLSPFEHISVHLLRKTM